ncbi:MULTISPECIES: hypothetical protein [Kribbella]|uniref:hypothetical protein n=1 Tax=Kribbella TaxID=182639 RepID=UPI0013052730|nr:MULTISPECIES: hypothetical protein [Kribbella]
MLLPTGRFIAGDPTPRTESTEVHWVEPSQLTNLTMDRSMRRHVDHHLSRTTIPYFD